MNNLKIKKGDTVLVISGKARGKQGKVEQVFPKKQQAVITGINIIKKHLKPSRNTPQGGIIDKAAPVAISNLQVVCPRCSKPSRVAFKITSKSNEKGKKIRICRKCKESIDNV